jgi:APA family basic amino acid/polyamine antiporter
VAIAAAVLISVLNYLGVKKAGEFQLVFTVLKVAIILGIVLVCFSGAGSGAARGWSNFASTFTGAKGGVAGFMAALVAALWAYDGWNDLNMVAGEVQRPERNIPIALIAGVATVGVLYMLVNAGVQYVLPASVIAASPRPASDASCIRDGTHGSEHRVGRHGHFDAGYPERHHHERRARTLRRGARRVLLSRRWPKCIRAFIHRRLRL